MYRNKEWLKKKYIDEGLSTGKIGKLCGVDAKTIWSWMKKYNIPCRERHIRKRAIKICPICGKGFEVFWHDRNKTIHCSNKCRIYALHRNNVKNVINGEFYVNSRGYISKFGSGTQGYHIDIIEKIIGRKTKKNECVHHINLDKQDNNIENLLLSTNSKHQKLHGQLNEISSQLIKNGTIILNLDTEQYELINKGSEINV